MHTLRNIGFVFTIILGILGCNFPSTAQTYRRIELVETLSIGDGEKGEIYQWAGIATDEACSIYITDMIDYSIKKYDGEGEFIKKTGGRGKGPGEFTAIRQISVQGDNVYVTDQMNSGIQIFNRDLTFKRRIDYNLPIVELKAVNRNTLMITAMNSSGIGSVLVLDSLGKQIKSIPYMSNTKNSVTDLISFECDRDGNMIIAHKFKDLILKLNKDGEETWRKELLGGIQSKRKSIFGIVAPKDIIYKDIVCDTRGNIFVLGGSYSENKSCDIYVLTPHGEKIAVITLPEKSHCIHIDRQNNLYARASMGAGLKKYQIVYQ